MPGCALEMDQHTPASSGYIHKAPAGNPYSGENSNIHTWCLIAGKTQTNTHIPLLLCLTHTNAQDFFTVTSHELNSNFMTARLQAMEGWNKYNLQSSLLYTLVS